MSVCECATERVSASVMHVCVCVCVSECACVGRWVAWDGQGLPICFSEWGPSLPPPLLSLPCPSPLPLHLSPSLPASPIFVAGAPSLRWCWPRSGAPHTLLPSSVSPRRPFEARRPWWRMRSQCSAGICLCSGQAASTQDLQGSVLGRSPLPPLCPQEGLDWGSALLDCAGVAYGRKGGRGRRKH